MEAHWLAAAGVGWDVIAEQKVENGIQIFFKEQTKIDQSINGSINNN